MGEESCSTESIISNISLTVVASLFIILKLVEVILRQVNQHHNYSQQNVKLGIMKEAKDNSLTEGVLRCVVEDAISKSPMVLPK